MRKDWFLNAPGGSDEAVWYMPGGSGGYYYDIVYMAVSTETGFHMPGGSGGGQAREGARD